MNRNILNKIGAFLKNPASIKFKLKDVAKRGLTLWAKFHFRPSTNLGKVLAEFQSKRPAKALPPDYADLWFLYKEVRRRKPRVVLEFGGGGSTVILAQALFDNAKTSPEHRGFLYSIDADQYWTGATAKAMPEHLKNCYEISYSPLLEVEYAEVPGWKHAKIPNIIPDFLYLDGPAGTAERKIAFDVLDMENKLPKNFYVVIDGRKENALFFKKHLKRSYNFRKRKFFFTYIFELIN